MLTDTQKTLELLKEAGDTGIHSFELNRLVGTTRSAARVNDLKKQGYNITSKAEKMGDATGVRYTLPTSPKTETKKTTSKPKYRYEYDPTRQVYKAYAIL